MVFWVYLCFRCVQKQLPKTVPKCQRFYVSFGTSEAWKQPSWQVKHPKINGTICLVTKKSQGGTSDFGEVYWNCSVWDLFDTIANPLKNILMLPKDLGKIWPRQILSMPSSDYLKLEGDKSPAWSNTKHLWIGWDVVFCFSNFALRNLLPGTRMVWGFSNTVCLLNAFCMIEKALIDS